MPTEVHVRVTTDGRADRCGAVLQRRGLRVLSVGSHGVDVSGEPAVIETALGATLATNEGADILVGVKLDPELTEAGAKSAYVPRKVEPMGRPGGSRGRA